MSVELMMNWSSPEKWKAAPSQTKKRRAIFIPCDADKFSVDHLVCLTVPIPRVNIWTAPITEAEIRKCLETLNNIDRCTATKLVLSVKETVSSFVEFLHCESSTQMTSHLLLKLILVIRDFEDTRHLVPLFESIHNCVPSENVVNILTHVVPFGMLHVVLEEVLELYEYRHRHAPYFKSAGKAVETYKENVLLHSSCGSFTSFDCQFFNAVLYFENNMKCLCLETDSISEEDAALAWNYITANMSGCNNLKPWIIQFENHNLGD